MELIVKEVNIPEKIEFNYQELKSEIETKLELYNSLVYQEKDLKTAKSDKANLNRLKKALNDERIRREKEYMKPFIEFKNQINEIIDIIDKPVRLIDNQIKDYEKIKKEEKNKEIIELFAEINQFEWLKLNKIFDSRWLNSSYRIKKVKEDMILSFEKIESDLTSIDSLEYSFEIKEYYKKSLDLNYAISEVNKIKQLNKQKEEAERQRQEYIKQQELLRQQQNQQMQQMKQLQQEEIQKKQQTVVTNIHEEVVNRQWIGFKANLSFEEAKLLNKFFKDNNIEFKPL